MTEQQYITALERDLEVMEERAEEAERATAQNYR